MGYEKEDKATRGPDLNAYVVEATDANGSVAGRDAFKTQAEADAHAAEMRAKGFKVELSTMEPKPKEQL